MILVDKKWEEAEYLMISGIQHYLFCRRQWALIHVEQEWEENYFTSHGRLIHERVDRYKTREKRREVIKVRGLPVASYRLGMSGRCDLVEFYENEDGVYIPQFQGCYTPYPVEFKRGKVKKDNSDRFQLLAQIISLEDMLNINLFKASVFYHEIKRRVSYVFSEKDKQELVRIAEEMHQLFERGYIPKPKYQKKCKSCSLKNICLPELNVVESVDSYLKRKVQECENF